MACLLCDGRRKTKRVTVPQGTEPPSVASARHVSQQQRGAASYTARLVAGRQQPVRCHMYPYHELQIATGNFDDSKIVGEGGFGRVYKGRLSNGTVVAVKRLDRHGLQGDLEFNVEVSIMAGLHHANLVPLLGSCCEADQRVAVFEYMPHGNLRDLLDGKVAAARHFNWPARLNVLLGVAKGLAYLHEGANPAIVHRDLKSSNILIDGSGQARICDFGLARHKMLLYDSQQVPGPPPGGIMMGTYGYMAPEYAASGQITDKSDVYAFGVVVLEMMTGMQAVDARRPTGCEALPQLLQPALQAVQLMQGNLDPALNRHAPLPAAQLAALCEVAASCLETQPNDRPNASRMVTYLQGLLKFSDSTNAPTSRHGRTVSSPHAGPSHTHSPSVSDTPRDFYQQPTAGPSSSSHQQQQPSQQQSHQQHRHRPAQSMPHMAFTSAAAGDTAGTAASAQTALPRGHDLRSSAGYGNELGIPGPSRHLTPLAQGLHAASMCSLPAAFATAAAPAAEAASGARALLPLAQEGPSSLAPVLYVQVSPSQQQDMQASSKVGDLLDRAQLPVGSGQALLGAGLMNPRRDLRDSAWGPSTSSLQPPSAPLLPRSSSAGAGDQSSPVLRPVNGHRPTQSTMIQQGKSESRAGHLRSASSPHDQSLRQLVQSRTSHQPLQQEHAAEPASCQGQWQPVASGTSKMHGHLTQQQSGNPFAVDSEAAQEMSSPRALAQLASGNPFMDVAAGSASRNQDRVGGGQEGGECQQAAVSIASDQGGSPTASGSAQLSLLKDAEMSPLQNGLIRAWPSPCKVQPPEVMAKSWHHFLASSSHSQQPGAQRHKQERSSSHQVPDSAPARVGVCLVCLDGSRDWQMVPCGHAAACKACAEQLRQHHLPCPVCRAAVTGLRYQQFQQTYMGSPAPVNGHICRQEQAV